MKHQVDKHRSKRVFEVGDLVYMKLQPYILMSVATRVNQKLSYKYFGPFTVLQRVGEVAYKLDLPAEARVHPVVHVSQLKKHIPPSFAVESDFSVLNIDHKSVPVRFLDSKLVTKGPSTLHKLKVQWSSLPPTCST